MSGIDHITERNEYPEYMLEKNQRADPQNIELFQAALNRDLEGVRRAIKAGGKVDFFHRPEDSKNALHVASEHGFVDIVSELIKNGAHVNASTGSDHETALTLATRGQHIQAVRLLLDHGASINAGKLNMIGITLYRN
jgi:ankyrin repeat protein